MENCVDERKIFIFRENIEVAVRMLVHDLIDLSEDNDEVKKLLTYYRISFEPNGGFYIALPRMMLEIKEKKFKDEQEHKQNEKVKKKTK